MIEALLDELTLEEKCSLLAGNDKWHMPGVERLGIGSLRMTDGPNGARGVGYGVLKAVCYPAGSALGASFDPRLVEEVAESLAKETLRRGAQILLGPTVNLQRVPLAGRNFECYSEDPLLSSRLVAASVAGMQSQGIAACVKHFVCNEQETHRTVVSSEVSEVALHEVYLRPFEAAVAQGTWSIMSSYNAVNGVPAAESSLLQDVLRDQWGFDGAVISDWSALKQTVAPLVAGTDIEMPGPPAHRGAALIEAVNAGLVSSEDLDTCVRRVLLLFKRTGRLGYPEPLGDETSEDDPRDRALIRRAIAETTVLMHNDGLLPLPSSVERMAVIGPNADPGAIQGGGSAKVLPHSSVSPVEGLGQIASQVRHCAGTDIARFSPILGPEGCTTSEGDVGILAEVIGADGEVVKQRIQQSFEAEYHVPGIAGHQLGRWTTTFTPQHDGTHRFGFIAAGPSRFFIDDELRLETSSDHIQDAWLVGSGCPEQFLDVEMAIGKTYELCIILERDDRSLGGIRLGLRPPGEQSLLAEAVELAEWSDVSVVVVGMTSEWETEGRDRDDLSLPGSQVELIQAVAAACAKTIVVLNVGAAVDISWLSDVNAVLCVWYPGQEFGAALADLVSGKSCPSGRLAQTWPVEVEDHPGMVGFPGTREKVVYPEGTAIGYRGFEGGGITPALPFGFGLSYGRPEFQDVRWDVTPTRITAAVVTSNESEDSAAAVWQFYIREQDDSGAWLPKELVDFAKVSYEPGQGREVTLVADHDAFRTWNAGWSPRGGPLELIVASNAADELASVVVEAGFVRLTV